MKAVLIAAVGALVALPLAAEQVQVMESQVPITVTEAQLQLDKSKTTVVTYTVTNQGAEPIISYRLRVYRKVGERTVGFKTFVKKGSIEPGASVKGAVILGWVLGARESISLQLVSTNTAAVTSLEEPPCSIPCDAGFCTEERTGCAQACNHGSPVQCIWSFRCIRKCDVCESDCVCKNWC